MKHKECLLCKWLLETVARTCKSNSFCNYCTIHKALECQMISWTHPPSSPLQGNRNRTTLDARLDVIEEKLDRLIQYHIQSQYEHLSSSTYPKERIAITKALKKRLKRFLDTRMTRSDCTKVVLLSSFSKTSRNLLGEAQEAVSSKSSSIVVGTSIHLFTICTPLEDLKLKTLSYIVQTRQYLCPILLIYFIVV